MLRKKSEPLSYLISATLSHLAFLVAKIQSIDSNDPTNQFNRSFESMDVIFLKKLLDHTLNLF